MYTESNGQAAGDRARLISPRIPFTGHNKCMVFYYNIHGKRFGSLSIKDQFYRTLWTIIEDDLSSLSYC